MNENTKFIYENSIGTLEFGYNSPFWITDFDGISSVEIDIFASQGPMQNGSSVTARSVRPRSFTLDGAIFDPIIYNRERLINIIAPQYPATLTVIQNGESWYLDVVPERTPEITPGDGIEFFQTKLYAAYPYWRTTQSNATNIPGLIALFKFPFFTGGAWWISKYSDDYFATIENQGNIPIEFKVIFTARGDLSNPEIVNINTGKRILIKKSMLAGESIIVSTIYGQKGVTCIDFESEVTNGFKYLSIDSDLSMVLAPGSNLFKVDAQNNKEVLGVRIEAPKGVKSGV